MSPGFTIIDNDAVISRLPEIDGTAVKVFLAIARRADAIGQCWPSQPTIAVDTGLRVRAVRNAVDRLAELGLIAVEQRPGMATRYHITPAPPCRSKDEGEAPPCRTPRHDDAGDPGTAVPDTPAPPCPRTIPKNNTQEQHQKNNTQKRGKAAEVSIPDPLLTDAFKEKWEEWKEYRRSKRKPLAAITQGKQLAELSAWGEHKAIEALDTAMKKGWQGFFEPTEGGNKNGHTNYKNGAGQRHDPETPCTPI